MKIKYALHTKNNVFNLKIINSYLTYYLSERFKIMKYLNFVTRTNGVLQNILIDKLMIH